MEIEQRVKEIKRVIEFRCGLCETEMSVEVDLADPQTWQFHECRCGYHNDLTERIQEAQQAQQQQ